jgi:type VI secretion system secreted protein Hcp
MAVDMTIKIDGIKGESVVDKHADEIDVLSWSWGMTNAGSFHAGGGGGAGKVNVNDLQFTKWVDASTPGLMLACSNGKHLKQAVLTLRKAGEKPLEYLKVTLTKCFVSSVSTGGSHGEDRLSENVTLNFNEVKVEYQQQDDAGAAKGSPVIYSWNIGAVKQPA